MDTRDKFDSIKIKDRASRSLLASLDLKKFNLILLLLFFLLGGCAINPLKPSPVSIEVDWIRQALSSITESYEKKDEKTFFSNLDPSFKFLEPFKNQVLQDFDAFAEIDIQMTIDWVKIQEGLVSVAVHWGGVWKTAPAGPSLERKGHALFGWTPGENPRLLEISGDPPFGALRGGI